MNESRLNRSRSFNREGRGSEEASEVKPAISIAGNCVGCKSQYDVLAEVIMAKVEVRGEMPEL